MKKAFTCLVCSTLLLSIAGCTAEEESVTALQLMTDVNSKNILHTDAAAKLWYQINPYTFADSIGDGIGDINGIKEYLSILSDGDENTNESDLNINGLYLTNVVESDNSQLPLDYMQLNRTLGTEDDLKALITAASNDNMAVMIDLNLAAFSKQSPYFIALADEASALKEGQGVEDLDQNLSELFILNDEKKNDSWYKLGSSSIYYFGYEGDAPNINQDSSYFKSLVEEAVDYYLSLGVRGFYLHDINSFYNNDDEKNVEFVNWFYDMVKAKEPNATVIANADPYKESMKGIKADMSDVDYSGAEGYIAKAVTNSISAKQLGEMLKKQENKSAFQAVFLNNDGNTLDLLKSVNRTEQLKMALALHLLMTGQVFISAGDEIGLSDDEVTMITSAFTQGGTDAQGEALELTFKDLESQETDGNSILNFVKQAILLRDSYAAISSGTMDVMENLTTDEVLAVKKDTDSSSVILVFNLSDKTQSVSTSNILIQDLPCELGGILLTGTDDITFENDELTLPAYSAAVLK